MLTDIHNDSMRAFFLRGETLAIQWRKQQLRTLDCALTEYEERLYEALWTDMGKTRREAFMTEIMIVRNEIRTAIRHLSRWAKDERVRPSLLVMPSHSYIHYEPLGTALIIAPWNYPVNLLLCPLVGAISAGCCAMLKPSPYVPNVSHVLYKMIHQHFDPQYIDIVEGHRDVNTALLNLRWDMIFFTGSPALAKTVMSAATQHLTPCVLELGGKSPCIVDKEADLKAAAQRIAWGKTLNNGQTCIAPDYLLLHEDIAESFLTLLDEARTQLRTHNDIVRKVRPHVEDVWQQEIFGPEFPHRTFTTTQEAIDYVNEHEKPLALYYFGSVRKGKDVIRHTSSGGAVINDTLLHIVNPRMPFGGVGNSGMGKYHHRESFLAFSNRRAVVEVRSCWNRLPLLAKLKMLPFKTK